MAETENLQYRHERVARHADYMFYKVIAYKSYDAVAAKAALKKLKPGMTEREVFSILRE